MLISLSIGKSFPIVKWLFFVCFLASLGYSGRMETTTEAELAEYVAEAMREYSTLAPLEATIALALAEARETILFLAPRKARTAERRKNRDAKESE
jgi:hypothetical protein